MAETRTDPQPLAGETGPGKRSDTYRNPRRVAILMLVAPLFYWIWWLWQVFNFTRREHFPRARRFWWILIPFYGVYLLYQQFDDIKMEARRVSGQTFNAALAGWLVFIGLYGGSASNQAPGWVDLLLLLVSGLALSIAAFLVQRAANAYMKASYPTEKLRRMTLGEIVAAVLGILTLALFILGAFPASA